MAWLSGIIGKAVSVLYSRDQKAASVLTYEAQEASSTRGSSMIHLKMPELVKLTQKMAEQSRIASKSDHSIRELQNQEQDLMGALGAKDSLLAILRVGLGEADRETDIRQRAVEGLQLEMERVLRDQSDISSIHCQALDSLKLKLKEVEGQLQREEEAHKRTKQEAVERQARLEEEIRSLTQALTTAERKLSAENVKLIEVTNQMKGMRPGLKPAKREWSKYKEKATRILKCKNQLIASLPESSGASGDAAGVSHLEYDTVKQDIEAQVRPEIDTARETAGSLEDNLSKEKQCREDVEQELPRQKKNIKNTNGLHMDERSLLHSFFEDILKKSSVDYSCNEIEDIQTAVLEMLERIAVKINERGLFNISRIEPCGSMAEKAALWKTYNKSPFEKTISEKYLEFDFLAVLAKTDDIKLTMLHCKGCKKVHGSLLNNTLLQKYDYMKMLRDKGLRDEDINIPRIIDRTFRRELGLSIMSLCNCLTIQGAIDLFDLSFTQKIDHLSAGCTECSISRASGTLKIAPGSDDTRDCTLILQWESKSSSLFAPVGYSIKQTQNMKRFRIHIDFIAALETLQEAQQGDKRTVDTKCFIVSKWCSLCMENRWKISGCIEEIKAITNKFSMKHKKCYMILKYIFQTGEINNYIMKTAVLHHHTTCTDTSEDMVACVTTILQELCDAFKRGHLQAYCRPVKLKCHEYNLREHFKSRVLYSIDLLDSFIPHRRAFEDLVLKDIRT